MVYVVYSRFRKAQLLTPTANKSTCAKGVCACVEEESNRPGLGFLECLTATVGTHRYPLECFARCHREIEFGFSSMLGPQSARIVTPW